MKIPTKAALAAFACALVTACAGTRDVTKIQRTHYAIDEGTANVLVRDALESYPLVERGDSDRLETRWIRGRDGSAYKLVVHIDGPGGGPFIVRVTPTLRDARGAIFEHDIPRWLADERDRVAVRIYDRMKPTAIETAPASVATR
jgi:hypothetical protein